MQLLKLDPKINNPPQVVKIFVLNGPAIEVREGNGTLLQYSCLPNPMDGGAWWAAVHGVTRSRT